MNKHSQLTWEDEARHDPRPKFYDGPEIQGPKPPEVYRRVYLALAIAGADHIIDVLTHRNRAWHLYTADDLAVLARDVFRSCILHQLAGGQPTDTLKGVN